MLSYEGHTLQTDYSCLYVFDFEYQMCRKKEEILNPRLNTDTVLWWLQPTPEMGLASGFETYLTAYCSYQTKRKQKIKNIKTKVIRAYAEVPEGETEVWAICTAPLLGTRKQTSTEWSARNSPPSWDRRIWADCVRFESSRGTQIIMFYYLIYVRYHLLSDIQLAPEEGNVFYSNTILELKKKIS